MNSVRVGLFVCSLALLPACPTPQDRCAPSCLGCCDLSGQCQDGQSNQACGAIGNACVACNGALQCINGQCTPSSATGGNGGGVGATGGAGGGSAGGGTMASVGQELVSGTRLKAIVQVGADGSRSPWSYPTSGTNTFWDAQLETICLRSADSNGLRNPSFADQCTPLGSPSAGYSDSMCTQRLSVPPSKDFYAPTTRELGRSLKRYVSLERSDGGSEYFLVSSTAYVGNVYCRLSSGQCTPCGAADGGQFDTIGLPVSLATHVVQIE